jgi:hypothetical protein
MRRYALAILLGLNALLLGALAWAWLTPSGELRNVKWMPPEPVKPDLVSMLPNLPGTAQSDTSQFLRMLDRPVFSSTRRPPPPPPPPKVDVPEPVNWFAQAKLTGVYEGQAGGGIIIFYDGKDRRVPLNGYLDGWKLQSVTGAQATFEKAGQTRAVALQRASLTNFTGLPPNKAVPPPPVNTSGRNAGGGQMPAQPSGSGGSTAPAAENLPRASFGGGR